MRALLFLTLLLAVSQAKDTAQMQEEGAELKADLNMDSDDLEEWDEEDLDQKMAEHHPRSVSCYTYGTTCGYRQGECQRWGADASRCEFLQSGLCRSSCECCIDCQKDTTTNCYTSGGRCKKRTNCGLKEYLDRSKTCNAPYYCGCCRKCYTPPACANGLSPGFCIGNESKLTEKHYRNATASCTQSSCKCYNRCVRKKFCADNNGRCIVKSKPCRSDETKFYCGCRDSYNCACCIKSSRAWGLTC